MEETKLAVVVENPAALVAVVKGSKRDGLEDRRETRVRVRSSAVVVAVVKGSEAMNTNLEVLRDMIPPAVRKTIYAAYLVAGIILGVLAIVGDWAWLDTGQEVYAYLGIPVGAIAVTNVVPNALVTAAPAEHVDPEA